MSNTDLVKLASLFANILAYEPDKPAPAGFVINRELSVDSPNRLKLMMYYNEQEKIVMAIARTNDWKVKYRSFSMS